MPSSHSVSATAPGKLVLWGEYAVLDGAPAAVMALNRRAAATLKENATGYALSSSGFAAPPLSVRSLQHIANQPVGALLAALLSVLPPLDHRPFSLHMDSSSFFLQSTKVGIGSSAATLVAVYGALARWHGLAVDLSTAISAHREFQGGGSGLDIACALAGGAIRFQNGNATPFELPAQVQLRVIYTGVAASSAEHVASFSQWRSLHPMSPELARLKEASEALFHAAHDAHAWQNYLQSLVALDEAAKLNIYTPTHASLAVQAEQLGLVYKPCGAGGGDVGVLISLDANDQVPAFEAAARALGANVLPIGLDASGLIVT